MLMLAHSRKALKYIKKLPALNAFSVAKDSVRRRFVLGRAVMYNAANSFVINPTALSTERPIAHARTQGHPQNFHLYHPVHPVHPC